MRRLIGVFVSAALLALLYAYVDVGALWSAVRAADLSWLAIGILMVVPLTAMTAARFTLLVRDGQVGFGEANRLILAASTLNLFLPSKLGDLAKGHVLARRHGMQPGLSYAIVVLEKALDMLSLLVWGTLGLIVVGQVQPAMLAFLVPVGGLALTLALLILPLPLLPNLLARFGTLMPQRIAGALTGFSAGWDEALSWFWRFPARAAGVILLSLVIWGVHLFQFWLFTRAVHGDLPIVENAAFATLSILAGLLPFTFAGVGTRDAAIVFFYAPYLSAGAAAFLGLLATLRYVLPALAGVPFVADFAGLAGTRAAVRARDGAES